MLRNQSRVIRGVKKSCSHNLRGASAAGRGSRCGLEVDLVVNVVASVGSLSGRRVDGTTSCAGAGEENIALLGREVARRAAESATTEDGSELAESPADSSSNILLSSTKDQRGDRLDTLIDVTEKGGSIEVGSQESRGSGNNNVGGVDLSVGIGESLNSTVRGATAVPVLGPLLGNVLEVASVLVELPANDARDGFVVGDTTGTVGTVAEEVGVESEGTKRDDLREGEGIEVGVVLLAEVGVLGVLLGHD